MDSGKREDLVLKYHREELRQFKFYLDHNFQTVYCSASVTRTNQVVTGLPNGVTTSQPITRQPAHNASTEFFPKPAMLVRPLGQLWVRRGPPLPRALALGPRPLAQLHRVRRGLTLPRALALGPLPRVRSEPPALALGPRPLGPLPRVRREPPAPALGPRPLGPLPRVRREPPALALGPRPLGSLPRVRRGPPLLPSLALGPRPLAQIHRVSHGPASSRAAAVGPRHDPLPNQLDLTLGPSRRPVRPNWLNLRALEGEEFKAGPKRRVPSDDPAWKYADRISLATGISIECRLCGHKSRSGITRMRQHLAGIGNDIIACPETTEEMKREMKRYMQIRKLKEITRK